MSLDQVEGELARVAANVLRLREELKAAEEWEAAVRTSVGVLRRLAGLPGLGTGEQSSANPHLTPTPNPRPQKVNRGQVIADAATDILRREGRRIKTAELAEMMKDLGLDLGYGIPGRVTTDLSNSLARYGKELLGTRTYGWGLLEWGDEKASGPGPNTEHSSQTTPSGGEDDGSAAVVGDLEKNSLEEAVEGLTATIRESVDAHGSSQ